jgi:hypothetical protein
MRTAFLVAAGLVAAAAPAAAQDAADSRFAVGVQVGTVGLGAEAQAKVNEHVVLRGSVDAIRYDADFSSDDIDYTGDLDFTQGGLFADLHPTGNAFFVSAGVYFGDRTAEFTATAQRPVEIGEQIFSAAEAGTLSGEADFGGAAPFVGLGWNNTFTTQGRWGFKLLAGAAFGGDPEVKLARTGGVALPAAVQARLDSELRNEERELEEDADDLKILPVVQIGVAYKF